MQIRRGFKQFLDIEFPEALQFDRKHTLSTLSKGIRVVTEPYHSNLCSIGLLIEAGSKLDGSSSGLAYLSSQLLLSGTKSRAHSTILSTLQGLGHFTHYTTRDSTWLQMVSTKENTSEFLKLLGELLTESTFAPEALNQLKNTVTRENEQLMNQPQYLLSENLHRIAFKQHGIGGFIRGDEESIAKITRNEVAEFVASNYTSGNVIISACGAVDHAEIVGLAEKHLWRMPTSTPRGSYAPDFNSTCILQESEADTTYIAIGYPSASFSHPSLHYFYVLQNILTTGRSPSTPDLNFLQSLLDITGCISHNCYLSTYSECGIMMHFLECEADSAAFLGGSVIRAMNRLGKSISPLELTRAKNMYFNQLLQQEGCSALCQGNADQVRSFKKRASRAELAGKVLEITAEELVANTAEWVNSVYPVIAVYGKISSDDLIEKIFQQAE